MPDYRTTHDGAIAWWTNFLIAYNHLGQGSHQANYVIGTTSVIVGMNHLILQKLKEELRWFNPILSEYRLHRLAVCVSHAKNADFLMIGGFLPDPSIYANIVMEVEHALLINVWGIVNDCILQDLTLGLYGVKSVV